MDEKIAQSELVNAAPVVGVARAGAGGVRGHPPSLAGAARGRERVTPR